MPVVFSSLSVQCVILLGRDRLVGLCIGLPIISHYLKRRFRQCQDGLRLTSLFQFNKKRRSAADNLKMALTLGGLLLFLMVFMSTCLSSALPSPSRRQRHRPPSVDDDYYPAEEYSADIPDLQVGRNELISQSQSCHLATLIV